MRWTKSSVEPNRVCGSVLVVPVLTSLLISFGSYRTARADESNLLACLSVTQTNNVTPDASVSKAAIALMDSLNHPVEYETVSKFDSHGKLLSQKRRELKTWGDEGEKIFSATDRKSILEVLEKETPDSEFTNYPVAAKQRIIEYVENSVQNFPTSIPGQSLTEFDREAKLNQLSLGLRRLKSVPIVSIKNPELLAKQLSTLSEMIGGEVAHRVEKSIADDPSFQKEIVQGIEGYFCGIARNTASPTFKRAMPPDEYQKLVAALAAGFGKAPTNLDLGLPAFELNKIRSMNAQEIAAYLDSGGHREGIEKVAFANMIPFGVLPVMNAYGAYARSTDLATTDFHGGIPEKELNAQADSMKKVSDHEAERQLAYQEELRKKVDADFAETKKKILTGTADSVLSKDGPKRGALIMAFFVLNVLVVIFLFRQRKLNQKGDI